MRLFDQQMWCWGKDIAGQGSNLLLEYGLNRAPSPDSRYSSRYEFNESENSVILWGFGLWYTHSSIGSLLLKRHDFRPRVNLTCLTTPAAWRLEDCPPIQVPATEHEARMALNLCGDVLAFISRYEAWVLDRAGLAYRQQAVETYPERRKGFIPAQEMGATWSRLAESC